MSSNPGTCPKAAACHRVPPASPRQGPPLGSHLPRLLQPWDRRGKPARQCNVAQTHPLCSLVSLPIYISSQSGEQEEGMSCQLISVRCRNCSLKANGIPHNMLRKELLTIFTLCTPCFTPFDGGKKKTHLVFTKAEPMRVFAGNILDTFKPLAGV